jgi:hypothetical protein
MATEELFFIKRGGKRKKIKKALSVIVVLGLGLSVA